MTASQHWLVDLLSLTHQCESGMKSQYLLSWCELFGILNTTVCTYRNRRAALVTISRGYILSNLGSEWYENVQGAFILAGVFFSAK